MSSNPRPLALIILDGWGYSESQEFNAIYHADTPTWDRLWAEHPHTLLQASGTPVGLPEGQMGNSEVGHLNLGAGRVVYQDFTRIGKAIADGDFFTNPALTEAVDVAVDNDRAVHIFGLLSPGGVHSHEDHILAMLELAVQRGAEKLYLHAFLDGRDTPPRSAAASIKRAQAQFAALGKGAFASISGRYYAMDRDNRWARVEQAYKVIANGEAEFQAQDPLAALQAAYAREENDEFVKPIAILAADGKPVTMQDDDVVIFMNFRADRAREITRCFLDEEFSGFERTARPRLARFVCLSEYHKDFATPLAFPPETLRNGFGEYVAQQGLRQLRIAETEKYAHVTFFFNGGEETVYPGEERILVPSPQVATYDLQPEMSAPEVTEKLVAAIRGGRYDVIICNYANGDMVGHSGDYDAALRAAATVDDSLRQVTEAALEVGGEVLITADHGNIEKMRDPESGQAHTAHSVNPVPFIYVGQRAVKMRDGGALSDIAPTMLRLMGLATPAEMSGQALLELVAEPAQQSA